METKFEYDIERKTHSGEWLSCGLTITDYDVAVAQLNSYRKHSSITHEFRLRCRRITYGDWEVCHET